MRASRLFVLFGLIALLRFAMRAAERNYWPIEVDQKYAKTNDSEPVQSWQAIGPLFFHQQLSDGRRAGGFRPFYVYWTDPAGRTVESDFLYPLLTHRQDEVDHRWSLLELINFQGPKNPSTQGVRQFDVWPIYFSRDTGSPATSYHAVFPVQGTMLSRLGYDRLSWTLFPLYARWERHGVVTTETPWPFIKTISGDGNHGFALWPLFGWQAKAGDYHDRFFLWPLIYKNESKLSSPQPNVELGILPFYAREARAGSSSETYLWPFFGYTHRTTPNRYNETRWFWPLFVQGRGQIQYVNRWAPFYTHSNFKGDDKHWLLWPLLREEKWTDDGLVQTKTQVLYFLYWSLHQRSATNPALPSAQKTHFWPLLSYWNNGAGRRQIQVLNPLEVFFPQNESISLGYTPFFALYRHDQRAPGDVRNSLLWNAVTWRHSPQEHEFHLGPLFSLERTPARERITLGSGLIGLQRGPAPKGWSLFLFDFSGKPHKKASPHATP